MYHTHVHIPWTINRPGVTCQPCVQTTHPTPYPLYDSQWSVNGQWRVSKANTTGIPPPGHHGGRGCKAFASTSNIPRKTSLKHSRKEATPVCFISYPGHNVCVIMGPHYQPPSVNVHGLLPVFTCYVTLGSLHTSQSQHNQKQQQQKNK